MHKMLAGRSIGAQADVELIKHISLNLCAGNVIIRPKKVRGTTSATSIAIIGISAQQKDGLLTLTLYSISRDTPLGTSLLLSVLHPAGTYLHTRSGVCNALKEGYFMSSLRKWLCTVGVGWFYMGRYLGLRLGSHFVPVGAREGLGGDACVAPSCSHEFPLLSRLRFFSSPQQPDALTTEQGMKIA